MKGLFRFSMFLILILIVLTAGVLYIRPTQPLDMSYKDIVWKDKLIEMVETRQPEITLTNTDLNNLAKMGIAKALEEKDIPVSITGAEFRFEGNNVSVDFNAKWGFLTAGGTAKFQMEYSEGKLRLSPVSLFVKQIPISPDKLGLVPMDIDLATYLPSIIHISQVDFEDRYIKVRISADWMAILQYLQTL
ncbi:hypothetical protein EJP82_18405 [Paenibacillus anaericanus]|uniref:DUF2140 family protein n=2 Tax=Paenibacillus TaxID=44249 RepID=A0A433Y5E2_9BACL|nr:hypothetical protein [Paenibacillus anaericanus]RUT43918.1 hypothetical protein EJP82_18405 [Paenibacillus anaericanus]